MSDARRRAEEALAKYDVVYNEAYWDNGRTPRCYADHCADALRALLAEAAPACGSVSTVRSDDPPAAPLPTCVNCGSNLIEPAPAPNAVREAAERAFAAWESAQDDRLNVPVNFAALMFLLGAALDARPGGERGE